MRNYRFNFIKTSKTTKNVLEHIKIMFSSTKNIDKPKKMRIIEDKLVSLFKKKKNLNSSFFKKN